MARQFPFFFIDNATQKYITGKRIVLQSDISRSCHWKCS